MSNVTLSFKTVTEPDFGGFMFFVESGRSFDADDYAEAYGLATDDLSDSDVRAAQSAAKSLKAGEWLQVEHEAV